MHGIRSYEDGESVVDGGGQVRDHAADAGSHGVVRR
jgi:hypothetical protein